jgi:spore germination protein
LYVTAVKPGESLAQVAARTRVTPASIVSLNGLRSEAVTTGQALLIPSMTYYVQAGDTIASISQATGLTQQQLERANPGAMRNLYEGRRLILTRPQKIQGEGTGYLPITDPTISIEALRSWQGVLTWVPIFSYNIAADGTVEEPDDRAAIDLAYSIGGVPLLCITNSSQGAFDPQIARRLLTDANFRASIINTIVAKMNEKGYGGIDSDIEQVPEDLAGPYIDFLAELKAAMGPGKLLSTAISPSYGDRSLAYSLGHDYAGIGSVVDRAFLMNYDFHWVGGPPGEHITLNQERRVLQYALSQMPAYKIINGIETTAYDWSLPDTAENMARPLSDDDAVALAMEKRATITYDADAAAPSFHYWDENGQEHVVWFEDARSILAKIMLMRELGIPNIGYWMAGHVNTQAIKLTDYFFQIPTS